MALDALHDLRNRATASLLSPPSTPPHSTIGASDRLLKLYKQYPERFIVIPLGYLDALAHSRRNSERNSPSSKLPDALLRKINLHAIDPSKPLHASPLILGSHSPTTSPTPSDKTASSLMRVTHAWRALVLPTLLTHRTLQLPVHAFEGTNELDSLISGAVPPYEARAYVRVLRLRHFRPGVWTHKGMSDLLGLLVLFRRLVRLEVAVDVEAGTKGGEEVVTASEGMVGVCRKAGMRRLRSLEVCGGSKEGAREAGKAFMKFVGGFDLEKCAWGGDASARVREMDKLLEAGEWPMHGLAAERDDDGNVVIGERARRPY